MNHQHSLASLMAHTEADFNKTFFSSVCIEPTDTCGVCIHCPKQNNRDDTGTGTHQGESDTLDGIMYVTVMANVAHCLSLSQFAMQNLRAF